MGSSFSWPSVSKEKKLEYSFFASADNGISGVGGDDNGENMAVDVEEPLTVIAR